MSVTPRTIRLFNELIRAMKHNSKGLKFYLGDECLWKRLAGKENNEKDDDYRESGTMLDYAIFVLDMMSDSINQIRFEIQQSKAFTVSERTRTRMKSSKGEEFEQNLVDEAQLAYDNLIALINSDEYGTGFDEQLFAAVARWQVAKEMLPQKARKGVTWKVPCGV